MPSFIPYASIVVVSKIFFIVISEFVVSASSPLIVYIIVASFVTQEIFTLIGSEYDSAYERYEQIVGVLDPMLASLKFFHEDLKKVTI